MPKKTDAASDAVGGQDKGGLASTQRGARLTSPKVEIVGKAYTEATLASPHLGSIGFSRVGKSLPPPIKRTSGNNVTALLKHRLGASEISQRLKASRS